MGSVSIPFVLAKEPRCHSSPQQPGHKHWDETNLMAQSSKEMVRETAGKGERAKKGVYSTFTAVLLSLLKIFLS